MSERIDKFREKVARLEQRKKKLEAQLIAEKAKLRKKEERERNKRLFEFGLLCEAAGLQEFDRIAVMGGLLQAAEMLRDEPTLVNLKRIGQDFTDSQEDPLPHS